jgi:hypothetical protein
MQNVGTDRKVKYIEFILFFIYVAFIHEMLDPAVYSGERKKGSIDPLILRSLCNKTCCLS